MTLNKIVNAQKLFNVNRIKQFDEEERAKIPP